MKKIVAALLLATISLPTLAQDRWVHLSLGDDAFYQYDSKTLKRQGSKVYVWIKAEFRTKQTRTIYPIKDFWSSKFRMVFNCSNETMQALKVIQYASLDAQGEIVESSDWSERSDLFKATIPDTNGEYWMERFCGKRP